MPNLTQAERHSLKRGRFHMINTRMIPWSLPKADSLIAYTGLDPAVMQSGQMTGKHMHITKKGNSHLRATLYVAVTNMIMAKADNIITRYVLKKKNSGLSYKAAVIAGCSKLLRLIHAMLRNGVCYSDK